MPVAQQRWRSERALERQQTLRAQLAQLQEHGVDHLHPQEPDARLMKCDGRGLFAYNAQVVVDDEHDLIVALDVCTDENDLAQLEPMMQRVCRGLGAVAKQTVADGGYGSGEQLHAAHRAGFPVLVQARSEPADGRFPKSSFAYDKARDGYVCPRGEFLSFIGHDKPRPDATYRRAVYRCHVADCPERAVCTSSARGRNVKRTPFDDDLDHQRSLLAKPELRVLYGLRKEIVEHIFGCIKGNAGFRRFTVRGLAKVLAQWALACIAFNLRKLHQASEAGGLRQLGMRADA
ncbi:MAG: transposase [Minicystis sp.]